MGGQLRKSADLPQLGGTIIADSATWRLEVVIEGPDRRYVAGSRHWEAKEVLATLEDLRAAVELMHGLCDKGPFSGEYRREFGRSTKVIADNEGIRLEFSVSSSTFVFWRVFSMNGAENLLGAWMMLPERGERPDE